MRNVDYGLAWILLITAVMFILVMETTHPRGAILDIPFFWLVIAMMNFLRLRNSYATVKGLRTSCIGANLIGLTMEIGRLGLSGASVLRYWGPYTVIAAVAMLGELLFSIFQSNDSGSPGQ